MSETPRMTKLLRLEEALPLTGYRSRSSGELPGVRLSSRALRIREEDLQAFIRARVARATAEAAR